MCLVDPILHRLSSSDPDLSAKDFTGDHSARCSNRISANVRSARTLNCAGHVFDVLALTTSSQTGGVSGRTGMIQLGRGASPALSCQPGLAGTKPGFLNNLFECI